MLIWSSLVSIGPLAQSVVRAANNAYAMSSRLVRTRFLFFYLNYFISVFKSSLRKLNV